MIDLVYKYNYNHGYLIKYDTESHVFKDMLFKNDFKLKYDTLTLLNPWHRPYFQKIQYANCI
jgi:hypothetical protein